MKYAILATDRKAVTTKLEEITGKKPVYTGAPNFYYELDGITVGKTEVETTDEADQAVMNKLIEEGLLKAVEAPEETEEASGAEISATAPQEAPVLGESEEAEEVSDEPAEATDAANTPEPVKPEFSYPLSQHSAESLKNLIFTVYAKGELLSKSSGGDFFISEALKEKLKDKELTNKGKVLEILKEASAADLRGLSFTDDKVAFTGFPQTDDPETIKAWLKLAEAINKSSIKQSRVQAKRNAEANEKFAFRTWLTRLGMNGPDLKKERALYYKNLTGHTAFRTPADEEKWKKRQAEKREALKTAKALANTESTTAEA